MARPCLAAALGVKEEQILFTASHNHSGPGTGGNFTSLLETVDAEYTEFLYTQVEAAACAAAQNVEPVRGTVHRGECTLNVYRRVHTCLLYTSHFELCRPAQKQVPKIP